jgi:hypothetical protein
MRTFYRSATSAETRSHGPIVDRLEDANLSERNALKLWRQVLKHAPGIPDIGKRVVEDLLTAYLKRQLGL